MSTEVNVSPTEMLHNYSREFVDIFRRLANEFEPDEVKFRTQAGRKLHYITARTAMNRLDEVVGPANWWDDYIPGENSVICKLSIQFPDGSIVTKADAGGYAGMADSGDDDKSGFSDAFKRAAAKWGVARYLYKDGVPDFGGEHQSQPEPQRREQPQQPRREAPSYATAHQGGPRPEPHQGNGGGYNGTPRNGRGLYAKIKELEQRHGVEILKPINGWMKQQGIDGRMVDLGPEDVAMVYDRAMQMLDETAESMVN